MFATDQQATKVVSLFALDLALIHIGGMETNSDDLNFAQAASALAIDPAQFSKLLKQKRFAGRRGGDRNTRFISRDEIARLFSRTLTDTEFARAQTVKAKSARTEAKRQAAPLRLTLETLLPYDPGFAAAAVEARDHQWQGHLLAKDIEMASPPMPAHLIPDLSAQQIFSRDAVEILLANVVRARDVDWLTWVLDPVARAQFPTGPEQLKI